jgi:hypothetical protein
MLGGHHSRICARQVPTFMDLMRAAGWPMKELARHAHVSVTHISDFLNVKKFFNTESVFRVARAFPGSIKRRRIGGRGRRRKAEVRRGWRIAGET